MIPLRQANREQFEALRAFLGSTGFTEAELCARLKIRNLGELKAAGVERAIENLDSPVSVLIHLFLDREPAPRAVVAGQLGSDNIAPLEKLGLLRPDPNDAGACLGTVMLYPVSGLYLVSDRDWEPETGRENLPRPDAVYLAITPNACDYLEALPASPCEAFLDLCSGAGVAALLAARDYAKSAVACDLLERCSEFAAWSAAMNGVTNVETLTGNLYDPVRGRTFDRITAHTPYVPSGEQVHIFRDGGPDGEQVTRGILAGLPDALRPGGQCYVTAAFAERRDTALEDRIRAILGAAEGEFDIFIAVRRRIGLEAFFQAGTTARQAREAGIESFAYCSIALQRRATARTVFTLKRNLASVRGPMAEWLLRWEAMRRETGFSERFLREKLTAAPGVRLRIEHAIAGKKWTPVGATIIAEAPFPVEENCPPWVSALVELCDGRGTLRDALETLKARGVVPPQASGAEFARLVQMLVSAGFLEIGSLRLPVQDEGTGSTASRA